MSGLQPAFHWHSPTVGTNNHFQLMFNRFRAAHACNAHLSWMNNAGPPTEHSGLSPHMPKHQFMLTTKKSRFCIYLDFFFFGPAHIFPELSLYKFSEAVQHWHRAKECWEFLLWRAIYFLLAKVCAYTMLLCCMWGLGLVVGPYNYSVLLYCRHYDKFWQIILWL